MGRILFATKNTDLRNYVANKLKRAGHSVTRVSDYDAALTLFEECTYDILLTTVDSEHAEELTFARACQHMDPDLRVMFITGFSAVAVRRPDEVGDDDCDIGTPIHLNALADEVMRLTAA